MSHPSIFPLPLTPIELCWVLEDCPSHPMHFFLRLELDGHLEHSNFEQALQKTIARHPLFNAIVEKVNRTQWQWIEGPTEALPVNWKRGVIDDLPPAPRLDITKERGLRVTVIENASASVVILQFQHTVCDGLSASEFTGDLLSAYTELVEPNQTVKYKKLDASKLTSRTESALSKKEKFGWYLNKVFSLVRVHKFYKKRPVFLLERQRPEESDPISVIPESLFCRYDRQQTVTINNRARETGKNLNSRLLTSMFSAFLKWREEIQLGNDDELYRVTTPINTRTAKHRTIPAANMVSLVCFDRTIGQTKDTKVLQEWIESELERIQEEHIELALPASVNLLKVWPSELIGAIKRKRFSGTVLLSNLGPILTTCLLPKEQGKIKAGNLLVEHAEFLAVIRPGHCATVAASSYAGRLTFGLHYDSRLISHSEASSLLTIYTDSLA